MRLKKFIKEAEEEMQKSSFKDKLYIKLKDLLSVLEGYEKSDEMRISDFDKIDTFKKYVKHFIDEEERKREGA
jgi:5'-deoxynucleotidase YfbR-like HD superfamily hydrolase